MSKPHHPQFAPQRVSLAARTLLLAIFLLPSLVPAGFMLQRNRETSLVEVTICSGFNHRTEWLNVDTGEYLISPGQQNTAGETPDSATQGQDLCPFAVSAYALTGLVSCDLVFLASYPVLESQQPAAVLARPPYLPPARGPPTLS